MKKEFTVQTIKDLKPVCDLLRELEDESTLFCLIGDLGAGKTTLVKEWMRAADVDDLVSSPSYSIINEYQSDVSTYYHMDLYRLKSPTEAIEIGLEEYIDSGNICIIEWPGIIIDQLPDDRVTVRISSNGDKRHILLERTSD